MPTHRHPRKKRRFARIRDTAATTVDVPRDAMTQPAPDVARALLAHNRGKGAGVINRFIHLYIDRSGRTLPDERKRALRRAMALVRRHA